MKKTILALVLLFSGIAYAQETITIGRSDNVFYYRADSEPPLRYPPSEVFANTTSIGNITIRLKTSGNTKGVSFDGRTSGHPYTVFRKLDGGGTFADADEVQSWFDANTGKIEASGGSGGTGSQGPEGDSAYEVAVSNGFVGTEPEWLASLQGADGATGPAGASSVIERPLEAVGTSRNLIAADLEKKLYFTSDQTLTITENFTAMDTGTDAVQLIISGAIVRIQAASGVTIGNGSQTFTDIGNGSADVFAYIIKTGTNSYLIL